MQQEIQSDISLRELAIATAREIYSVEVYGVKFLMDKSPLGPEGGLRQLAVLRCQMHPRRGNTVVHTFVLPLLSLWVDQFNNGACKAHMLLKHASADVATNPENYRLLKEMINTIKRNGPINYNIPNQRSLKMQITCDTTGTILRYGVQAGEYSSFKEAGSYRMIPTYDTKAKALEALLSEASRKIQIGGLDSINLNCIGDEFMEAMGFEKIEDECRRSPPMWRGDVAAIANATRSRSYDYYETAGNKGDSFVDLLEKALKEAG